MKLKRILSLFLCVSILLCGFYFPVNAATESHTVMSYNVNGTGDYGDNTAGIIQKVKNGNADLVGFQEVPYVYKAAIVSQMERLGYFGYGISDWDPDGIYGEAAWTNSVFFKTSKYTLIDYGTYSISETPEKPHAFIASLDTDDVNSEEYNAKWRVEGRPRNFNWFVLASKATGDRLIFASAHVQRATTSTTDYNAVALDLLGKQIKKMKAQYGCEAIVVGDFNSRDAAEFLAHGFTSSNPKNIATYMGGYVLDYITHSSGMTASGFSADADKTVSDHYAIYATVSRTIGTTYSLESNISAGKGSISFDLSGSTSTKALSGQTIIANVIPAPGYRVSSVSVGSNALSVLNNGLDANYSFTMPSANTTVTVKFAEATDLGTYNLNAIVASGSGKVHFGNDVTSTVISEATIVNFQATPAEGYKIGMILIAGESIEVKNDGQDSVYQFTMPRKDVTVSVSFISSLGSGWVFDSQSKTDWLASCGVAQDVSVGFKDENGDKYAQLTTKQSGAQDDPYVFIKPDVTIDADAHKYMTIVAKTDCSIKNASMYLCAGTVVNPTTSSFVTWQWINDGLWHEYVIDLSAISAWTGNVNLLRFDFFDATSPAASKIMLRSIKFSNSTEQATASVSKYSYALGESIKVTYSGIYSYLGALDKPMVFVGIYKKDAKPGSVASMQYAYVNTASGVVNFPADAAATSSYKTLPAGDYDVWLAYDGTGSGGAITVNNVMLANYKVASFTITSDAYVEPDVPSDSKYDFVTGGSTGDSVISAVSGHTVATAITNIAGLGGTSSVTIKKADGTNAANTDIIATGMIASVNGTEYTIVVFGDVDCDGNITVADAQVAYGHLKGNVTLSDAPVDAVKMTRTGAVSIIDIMAVLNMI